MSENLSRRAFAVNAAAVLAGSAVAGRSSFASEPSASPGRPGGAADGADLDLATMLEIASVPGIAQGFVRDGRAGATEFLGKADVEKGTPVTAGTVFEAASLSKPTVAYLTLLLVDRGLLALDTPLAEYLGSSPVPDDARGARITLRHVLSHSSGLQNWRFRADDKLRLAFDPGTRFQYSGEGFVLVQRVIERRTGKAFAQSMRQEVFEPLGMSASSFLWSEQLSADLARPHSGRGQPLESFGAKGGRALATYAASLTPPRAAESLTYPEVEAAAPTTAPGQPVFPNFLLPNAAASLLTTAGDYARFTALLIDDSLAPAALRLRPATRKAMQTSQVRLAPRLAWGLGVGLEESARGTLLWHWGDNGGYKNFVIADPTARRGRVIFTNGSGGLKVAERVLRAEYGELAAFLWV